MIPMVMCSAQVFCQRKHSSKHQHCGLSVEGIIRAKNIELEYLFFVKIESVLF